MAINNIGKYQVKEFLPGPDLHMTYSGVIGPICIDTNMDELLELQRGSPDSPRFVKMVRSSNYVRRKHV